MNEPLVAYRGLWDKFAAPASLGALTRAYSRGVASLAWWEHAALSVTDVVAMHADRRHNRHRQPLFFIGTSLPPDRAMVPGRGVAPDVFAVILTEDRAEPYAVYRWTGAQWNPAGCYVHARVTAAQLNDDVLPAGERAVVLVEAANTRADAPAGEQAYLHMVNMLRQALPHASLYRVSDFVELELLERVRRAGAPCRS